MARIAPKTTMTGMNHRKPGGPASASGAATATVAVGEGVAVGSGVGVAVGAGVAVGVGSGVAVGSGVGSGVDVAVGSGVGDGVGVEVGSGVAVGSGVGVAVGTGVDVGRGLWRGRRRRRRSWRRADAELGVAGDAAFRAVGVPDDASEGVPPFRSGNGYHVVDAGVAKQVEANDLRLLLNLAARKRRALEGEAVRQRFHHLPEGAIVAGGDGDPKLAAGRCPVLLEGPGGAVRLRLDDVGLAPTARRRPPRRRLPGPRLLPRKSGPLRPPVFRRDAPARATQQSSAR